jgi:hypothetical protein
MFSLLDSLALALDGTVTSVASGGAEIPEDPTPVWKPSAPAGTYAIGTEVHRVETHTVYTRLTDHTGAETTPPENDSVNWLAMRASNRMAAFDIYRKTQTAADGDLTIVLRPAGFVTDLWLAGLQAQTVEVTVQAGPDGEEVWHAGPIGLDNALIDRWSLYWDEPQHLADDWLFTHVEMCPDPVITITLLNDGPVLLGSVQAGRTKRIGETRWGAGGGPIDNSFYDFEADGTAKWVRREPTTMLECQVEVDPADANYVDHLIRSRIGVPTLYISSELQRHGALRVFGFLQSIQPQTFDNVKTNTLPIHVTGL